jgi:folate-binding protein YgfZ
MKPDRGTDRARARGALFVLPDRGLVEVRGIDRVRFLQGQLTQDLGGLDPAGPRSGCYALVLTPQGRIVSDLHVLVRPDAIWLETALERVAAVLARLARYVIADDVELADRSAAHARFGVEGPRSGAILEAAAGRPLPLAPDSALPASIAGAEVLVAAFGWGGGEARQVLAPAAAGQAVGAALGAAAAAEGAITAAPDLLEVLRVEAGIPRTGAELGEDVLPAEAGLLSRAVSFTKGCYTGQEVVARMASRGRVGHQLVGLVLEAPTGASLPARGAPLTWEAARVGEVTSAVWSPSAGAIALGYVRTAHAEAGTRLEVEGLAVRVAAPPFVALASGSAG